MKGRQIRKVGTDKNGEEKRFNQAKEARDDSTAGYVS